MALKPAIMTLIIITPLVMVFHARSAANHPDAIPEPVILSVADVPNDNGGWLRVTWKHSKWDWHPYHNVLTYRVLRHVPGSEPYWQEVGFEWAQAIQTYSHVAPAIAPNGTTTYMVRAVDLTGAEFWDSMPDSGFVMDNLTGVGEPPIATLDLGAAFPNPMHDATSIPVTVPGGRIVITVFDARGRIVRTLVDREMAAGRYEFAWDGRSEEGAPVSPGAYFYRLESGGRVLSGRVFRVR